MARMRIQPRDLGLIPSGVAPLDQLRSNLGWRRPHSGLADPFVVSKGNRGAAYRRQIGVDGGTIADGRMRIVLLISAALRIGTYSPDCLHTQPPVLIR